jgi:hypothetical protein
MNERRYYASRRRELVRLGLLSLALLIEASGLALNEDALRETLIWIGLIATVWVTLLTLSVIFRIRPLIMLSKDGISHMGFWHRTVPWKYVGDVHIGRVGTEIVCLSLRDGEAFFREVPARPGNPWYARRIWLRNQGAHARLAKTFPLFGSNMLDTPLDQLVRDIKSYRTENGL